MARTPLLHALQRVMTDYRLARAHRVPVHAIREWRAAAQERAQTAPASSHTAVTRRAFLTGAGALAAALTVPRLTHASRDPRIVIVGGGIAGLTCALTLADRGIPSTVYEASGRVGGRIFSNTAGYWDEGQISEWGGEFIDTGHTTMRRLARRFELDLVDVLDAQPRGAEDTYAFGARYYPQAEAETDFAPVFELLSTDLRRAPFPTTFNDFTRGAQKLDNMSVYDWIESRVEGGHSTPFGQLLDVAYATEYGADTIEQSALNLIYLLGFQPDPPALSIFGESDERFRIEGGNQRLPRAIAHHLGIGEVVQPGMQLVRLVQTPHGRYRLWFDHHGDTTEVVADYVVLAIPFAVLRHLDYQPAGFQPLKRLAIEELGAAHNGKLQLQFATRHWNQTGRPWPGVSNGSSYTDVGYQSSWDVTRGQSGHRGILNFYSGGSVTDAMRTRRAFVQGNTLGVEADAEGTLSHAEQVFPGLRRRWNRKVTQSLPHNSRFFRASYAFYQVGQYTSFAGIERVRQGGVLFCGEHTSINFQGFMEGGASEGVRAARQLVRLIHGQ